MKNLLFLGFIATILALTSCNNNNTSVGSIVAKAKYDETRPGPDGTTFVREGNFWGVIDVSGKELIPIECDSVGRFLDTNETIVLGIDGKLAAYWPKTGAQTEFKYRDILEIGGNHCIVATKTQGMYDVYSAKGTYLISNVEYGEWFDFDVEGFVIRFNERFPDSPTAIVNIKTEKVIREGRFRNLRIYDHGDRKYFVTLYWAINEDGVELLPGGPKFDMDTREYYDIETNELIDTYHLYGLEVQKGLVVVEDDGL